MSEETCKPLKVWIHEAEQKVCRPCVLPLLAHWYKTELEERGMPQLGEGIKALSSKPDVTPDELAEELDGLKQRVSDESIKKRLFEFDCAVQKNESSP